MILRREALFQDLELDQIGRIVNFFDIEKFEPENKVFSEGDPAEKFYILVLGKIRLYQQQRNIDQLTNILSPGEFFGESALLFDTPRIETAITEGETTLISLRREQFNILLEEYPNLRTSMVATAESRRLIRKVTFKWLAKDEIIYLVTRKHLFFLFQRELMPVFIILLLSAGLLFLFLYQAPSFILTMVMVFLGIAVLWFFWVLIDWGNDYYIVTSNRVVWQEKVLALYDSRQEAPMNVVMAVDSTTSQLGRILGYGDVNVRTLTGGVQMRGMHDPKLFTYFVERYRRRAQAISREKQHEEMGGVIGNALRRNVRETSGDIPIATAPPSSDNDEQKKRQRSSETEWWRTFLKVRYEEEVDQGTIITYRKHWFILLQKVGGPLFTVIFVLTIIGFLGYEGVLTLGSGVIATLFWLVLLAWLIYQYADWSNDIYQLTPSQILDIERKPLGREQKKTANLDAPDFRVEHTRGGFISVLLDFGNVIVNVGQTEFTFDGVYHPDVVHQDVANYREAFQERKRQDQVKRERDRMVDWFVTFYEQMEQLEKGENSLDQDTEPA